MTGRPYFLPIIHPTLCYFTGNTLQICQFIACNSLYAQDRLISAKDLATKLTSKDYIIVSARKPADYAKVHIKGAINVDLNSLYKSGAVKGILKSPSEIAKILGEEGLDKNKIIVLYDNGNNVNAGRLFWILDYMGYKKVKILNGHMKAWRAARKPVTKAPSKKPKVTVSATVNKSIYCDKAYVKSKMKSSGTVILDVQSKEEFDKGHISGAKNIEYKKIVNEDGTLKSKEAIAKIYQAAGITSDKEVIVYCASSARAGIVYFAFKYILNYPKVKVYDGGYNEWKV